MDPRLSTHSTHMATAADPMNVLGSDVLLKGAAQRSADLLNSPRARQMPPGDPTMASSILGVESDFILHLPRPLPSINNRPAHVHRVPHAQASAQEKLRDMSPDTSVAQEETHLCRQVDDGHNKQQTTCCPVCIPGSMYNIRADPRTVPPAAFTCAAAALRTAPTNLSPCALHFGNQVVKKQGEQPISVVPSQLEVVCTRENNVSAARLSYLQHTQTNVQLTRVPQPRSNILIWSRTGSYSSPYHLVACSLRSRDKRERERAATKIYAAWWLCQSSCVVCYCPTSQQGYHLSPQDHGAEAPEFLFRLRSM